jgi:hypothetical protein
VEEERLSCDALVLLCVLSLSSLSSLGFFVLLRAPSSVVYALSFFSSVMFTVSSLLFFVFSHLSAIFSAVLGHVFFFFFFFSRGLSFLLLFMSSLSSPLLLCSSGCFDVMIVAILATVGQWIWSPLALLWLLIPGYTLFKGGNLIWGALGSGQEVCISWSLMECVCVCLGVCVEVFVDVSICCCSEPVCFRAT